MIFSSPVVCGSMDREIRILNAQVDINNLVSTISELQAFGTRMTHTKQWQVARWLKDRLKVIGFEVWQHNYDWNGKRWPNVIAQIEGEKKDTPAIVVMAHFDSISHNSDGLAPGADDNGSGIAVILESARLLQTVTLEKDLYFCLFSNEEVGTKGSQAFVKEIIKNNIDIEAAINLDSLGYNRPQKITYSDALNLEVPVKYKTKALYRMGRNHLMGLFLKENFIKVAGRPENRGLIEKTSESIKRYTKLNVKRVIDQDCG